MRRPGIQAAKIIELATEERSAPVVPGVVIGELSEVGEGGELRVDFAANPTSAPLVARATVRVDRGHVGRQVTLVFEEGQPTRPIVTGLLREPREHESSEVRASEIALTGPLDVQVDGDRVVLDADKEIVLRCGKASISLTRDGRIELRGTYLLSRSSGSNKIKGASVRIN